MDISQFASIIHSKGIAKASTFDVLISRTKGGDIAMESELKMRVESTDFPGRSLTMAESNYAGVPYKIVSGVTFSEVPMSIILSENMAEKEYIESWQDAAIGNFRKGEIGSSSFNLGYYKDYIGTVDITQYNDMGIMTYQCKLIDAYPNSVGAVTSSWASGEEYLKLPVTFTYRYYKIEEFK